MAPGGAATRSIFSRMAVTAPVISSTVSPRTRSAINRPPICEGVASPDIMRSKPRAASSRESDAPVAALAMRALKSSVTAASWRGAERRLPARQTTPGRNIPGVGNVEKVFQDEMAVLGRDAFGMKLHAVHGAMGVGEPHHEVVVGFRHHRELLRHAGALDHERVVARRLERAVDPAKHASTLVFDQRELAMHRR